MLKHVRYTRCTLADEKKIFAHSMMCFAVCWQNEFLP